MVRKASSVQSISLKEFVSGEFSEIPEIETVFTAHEGNVFRVWAVVNDSTPEIRLRIYEREKTVIDEFPEYDFNFEIITWRNRDFAPIVSEPGTEVAFQRH